MDIGPRTTASRSPCLPADCVLSRINSHGAPEEFFSGSTIQLFLPLADFPAVLFTPALFRFLLLFRFGRFGTSMEKIL